MADSWKAGRPEGSRSYLPEQTVYGESDTRTKIGYLGRGGGTEAVLIFEKRENGWRLDSIVECGVKE